MMFYRAGAESDGSGFRTLHHHDANRLSATVRRAAAPVGLPASLRLRVFPQTALPLLATASAEGNFLSLGLSQQRFELFRRTRDDRALAANHDWALHQFGMLEQQRDDGLLVDVFRGIQPELLEALVFTNQVGDGSVEQVDDFLQPLASRMIFQIFDGVELDTARAKDFDRAARIPSARVVIQGYAFHWFPR
jgi:hypothetical protein